LMGERMILNAAFLVDRKSEPEFDRRLNDLADRYAELVTFKCVGNAPPFNFVDLVIEV
jgi:Gas vesicle synthesis protein GvpL/GvpF